MRPTARAGGWRVGGADRAAHHHGHRRRGTRLPTLPPTFHAVHLYVHVPFCARRCSYCDFAIAVRRETPSSEFLAAVLAEWHGWRDDPRWAAPFATIYFGGGTPSRLAPAAIARLLEVVGDRPGTATDVEVTLEANPEDVTLDRAVAWRQAGVNRISLGVQSFDPAVLAWMHRTHSAEDVPGAVAMLRDAGFDNISLDLIYAVPDHLTRHWARDLELALALGPEHLSLYGLTFEAGTPLDRWRARGEAHPAAESRAAAEYLAAHAHLASAGFEHYEVSNAARPGRRSRHNSAYWTHAPYLGLGPSAHSAAGAERWWNVRDWAAYARDVQAGAPVVAGREELDQAARRLERLYLGLRTDAGVGVAELPAGVPEQWVGAGWARVHDGRVRLTPEGWLRLDALVAAVPDP